MNFYTNTTKNAVIPPNFQVWKLDEITVFFEVQFEFESKFKSRL